MSPAVTNPGAGVRGHADDGGPGFYAGENVHESDWSSAENRGQRGILRVWPSASILCSFPSTITRLAISSTISRSWVLKIRLFPSDDHSSRKSIRLPWLRGSSPLVGSSSNNTWGCMESTQASETFFFSPPESR